MIEYLILGVSLILVNSVETKSMERIRQDVAKQQNEIMKRSCPILTSKAKSYEDLIREHVPNVIRVEVRKSEKPGYSILEVTGKREVVTKILGFVTVLHGTVPEAFKKDRDFIQAIRNAPTDAVLNQLKKDR